jgi:hypothetical protein
MEKGKGVWVIGIADNGFVGRGRKDETKKARENTEKAGEMRERGKRKEKTYLAEKEEYERARPPGAGAGAKSFHNPYAFTNIGASVFEGK